MKYEDAIFICIDYIEKNIKKELTAEMIANEVGYSLYHFSRIFKENRGMPLMEYVKERRLICASKEIFQGKRIIDVAVEYGYETHSGFTKAFKKKFDFTPTLIHAMSMSCHLFKKNGGRCIMENANVFMKESRDFTKPEVLYTQLLESIKSKKLFEDISCVEKAYYIADSAHKQMHRKSGEPFIIHPLCVATILAEMEADETCIIAGLLHEVLEQDTAVTLEEIEREFSYEIAKLIEQATLLGKVSLDEQEYDSEENRYTVLIKLADRLHNMRTIQYMEPEKIKEKAKETIEFFSPIAAKLGIAKMKSELDDLALMYL